MFCVDGPPACVVPTTLDSVFDLGDIGSKQDQYCGSVITSMTFLVAFGMLILLSVDLRYSHFPSCQIYHTNKGKNILGVD